MLWAGGSSVWRRPRRLVPPRCPAASAGRAVRVEEEVAVGGGNGRRRQQQEQHRHYQQHHQRVQSLQTAMAALRVCIVGSGNW